MVTKKVATKPATKKSTSTKKPTTKKKTVVKKVTPTVKKAPTPAVKKESVPVNKPPVVVKKAGHVVPAVKKTTTLTKVASVRGVTKVSTILDEFPYQSTINSGTKVLSNGEIVDMTDKQAVLRAILEGKLNSAKANIPRNGVTVYDVLNSTQLK